MMYVLGALALYLAFKLGKSYGYDEGRRTGIRLALHSNAETMTEIYARLKGQSRIDFMEAVHTMTDSNIAWLKGRLADLKKEYDAEHSR